MLSEEEAITIVAGNLCEAIYRDLEQTTGIHVWTYGGNLTAGWLDQDGDFEVLTGCCLELWVCQFWLWLSPVGSS